MPNDERCDARWPKHDGLWNYGPQYDAWQHRRHECAVRIARSTGDELSVEDVRGYFTAQLDRLGNKRLRIGNIKAVRGTIAAEVVTVDNSLVQHMTIDRSTGNIDYEN